VIRVREEKMVVALRMQHCCILPPLTHSLMDLELRYYLVLLSSVWLLVGNPNSPILGHVILSYILPFVCFFYFYFFLSFGSIFFFFTTKYKIQDGTRTFCILYKFLTTRLNLGVLLAS
jgi:hypothetical protein